MPKTKVPQKRSPDYKQAVKQLARAIDALTDPEEHNDAATFCNYLCPARESCNWEFDDEHGGCTKIILRWAKKEF